MTNIFTKKVLLEVHCDNGCVLLVNEDCRVNLLFFFFIE